jgi:hypothetical protein
MEWTRKAAPLLLLLMKCVKLVLEGENITGSLVLIWYTYKSNPSSASQGIGDSYCTLPWVTWEAVTVVEGIS